MQGKCIQCNSYCKTCSSEQLCDECADGFDLLPLGNLRLCREKCGDGTRYEAECDDGNSFNGDGCSEDCRIETGYFCSGGTSMGKSTCTRKKPSYSVLRLTGTVNEIHKVFQGVQVTYLPDCALRN